MAIEIIAKDKRLLHDVPAIIYGEAYWVTTRSTPKPDNLGAKITSVLSTYNTVVMLDYHLPYNAPTNDPSNVDYHFIHAGTDKKFSVRGTMFAWVFDHFIPGPNKKK